MINVPFNPKFISRKIAKDLEIEATTNYMKKIVELRELPENIKAFEKRFKANGYTYDKPMKNEDFKAMALKQLGEEKAKDPIEVNNLAEKIKTGYTNHYLEYVNKTRTLDKIPEIIEQYETQIEFLRTWKPNRLVKLLSSLGI